MGGSEGGSEGGRERAREGEREGERERERKQRRKEEAIASSFPQHARRFWSQKQHRAHRVGFGRCCTQSCQVEQKSAPGNMSEALPFDSIPVLFQNTVGDLIVRARSVGGPVSGLELPPNVLIVNP